MPRPQRNRFLAEEFAKRLQIAMDNNPNCPPKYHGERVWLVERLLQRGVAVGKESIRKWVEGEALPTNEKMPIIAEALGVDAQWLMFGNTQPEAAAHSFDADALTNLIAGLIALDGGTIAFPAEAVADKNSNVHLHAVLRGANYPLHIVAGEVDGDTLTFRAPPARKGVIVLGVVRRDWGTFEIYELDEQVIADLGEYERGASVVRGQQDEFRRVTSFKERL